MSAAQLPSNAIVVPAVSAMPQAMQRYALTGTVPSAFRRDLVTVGNQIPRWGYAGIALGCAWLAARAYAGSRPKT